MCGIFGVINFDGKPVDKDKVLSARDILTHRGPDDSGVFYSTCHPELACTERSRSVEGSPSVAFAHRRLSIIDLSPAAHQPMTTEDGRYTIVLNGEIYNYVELREDLSSKLLAVSSEQFKSNGSLLTTHYSLLTKSDTEVILKLYALEGAECLNKLRGMFAFAIWDDKEKKLFAARDRFGIKPFYYLHNDQEFIFSSELKAIKHYKNGLTLSMEGMDAFLKTGSVPAPLTIYKETKALLPGQFIQINCHPERPPRLAVGETGSRRISIQSYWSFFDLLSHPGPCPELVSGSVFVSGSNLSLRSGKSLRSNLNYNDEAKELIRTTLLDSVKAHMVSDVEVGAFLSGGIDSTAIVSLMKQVGYNKIKTISVTFPGNKLDESKYSNLASKKYETNHFEYRLEEKELIDDFEKIIDSMDQPTIDGINTYFVSKAAASFGLKVVLLGLGGDELFGGYPSFINIPKYQKIKSLPLASQLMKTASVLAKNQLPAKAIEYFKNPDAPNAEYKLIRGLFTDAELKNLGWRSDSEQVGMTDYYGLSFRTKRSEDPESIIHHPSSIIQHLSPLQYVSYLESCFYMRNQLLRDSDVFSMAHSLELRVPFVDHLLYGTVLPYLDGGFDRSFPKKILVDGTQDLPDEIVHRPKQGFTFPFADWIRSGKIKDSINDSLNSSKMKEYFNKNELLNLQNSFLRNKIHWSRVWALYIISLTSS